ncbi:MAG: hypothetical protein AAF447_11345 [Myxococcota bacterium]
MTERSPHPSESGLAAPAASGGVGPVRVAALKPVTTPALVTVVVGCVGLGVALLSQPPPLAALEAGRAATLDGRALILDALRSSAYGLALGFPAGLAMALLADLRRSGRRAQSRGLTQLATSWLAAPAGLLALLAVGVGVLDARPDQGTLALALVFGLAWTLRGADRAFSRVPRALRTQALLLGATRDRVTTRLVLPQALPRLGTLALEVGLGLVALSIVALMAEARLDVGADELALVVALVLLAAASRRRHPAPDGSA